MGEESCLRRGAPSCFARPICFFHLTVTLFTISIRVVFFGSLLKSSPRQPHPSEPVLNPRRSFRLYPTSTGKLERDPRFPSTTIFATLSLCRRDRCHCAQDYTWRRGIRADTLAKTRLRTLFEHCDNGMRLVNLGLECTIWGAFLPESNWSIQKLYQVLAFSVLLKRRLSLFWLQKREITSTQRRFQWHP